MHLLTKPFFFFLGDYQDFLIEEVKAYLMTPISSLDSLTFYLSSYLESMLLFPYYHLIKASSIYI